MMEIQRAPGYAVGGAQLPMQRPMVQPTMPRPDVLRPPQGGPGTAAPPMLGVRQPMPIRAPAPYAPGIARPVTPATMPPRPMINRQPTMPPAVVQPPSLPPAMPNVGPTAPPSPTAAPPNSPLGNGEGVPLPQLGGLIQQQLANPTRFDLDAFKKIFDFAKGNLQQEAERSKQSTIADAARRGVFYSDAPDSMTGGFRDIGERYNRGLGELTSNLALEAARTGGSDFNSAMGNAFRYLENQQQADQFGANLGLNAAQLGYGGSPDINSILAAINGQPLPQLGQNPLEALGTMLGTLSKPPQTVSK